MKSMVQDIRADELQVLADAINEYWHELDLAQCESRNHKEHWGELWQCDECLRIFCWAEGATDDLPGLCDDCWCRHH